MSHVDDPLRPADVTRSRRALERLSEESAATLLEWRGARLQATLDESAARHARARGPRMPFGQYRGMLIEVLDNGYFEWLQARPWVRSPLRRWLLEEAERRGNYIAPDDREVLDRLRWPND